LNTQLSTRRAHVEIQYDRYPMSPREADNLGTLVTRSRGKSIHEQMRGVSVAVQVAVPASYVHRDATEAIIYVTPEQIEAEYGADNAETRARALEMLTSEAHEYRAWADGDVFGYTYTTAEQCSSCGEWKQTVEDSCWGFITSEPEHDLFDWISAQLPVDVLPALRQALGEGWTGAYPAAGQGTVSL